MDGRAEFEIAEESLDQDKPARPWQGFGLALAALFWSVLSSLASIVIVVVLTGG